jgi:hypothetical protein
MLPLDQHVVGFGGSSNGTSLRILTGWSDSLAEGFVPPLRIGVERGKPLDR